MGSIRLSCAAFLATTVVSSGPVGADGQNEYLQHVKPVLAERCYACHGVLKQEAGLRLDTAELAIRGGDSGAAIVRGAPDESILIQRVTASDESERMPPIGSPLKPEQIGALRAWITHRAPVPEGEQPEPDPSAHWAFRPIARPPVPLVKNSTWVRNPIDAFVSQRHEELGLSPQEEAPRELLVRRLYFDLIGLPPTDDELARVAADTGDVWFEQVVERLLADPRHGERWARHWMDIWRYSDWWGLGDQLRNSQPHIWHWRDWMVESLNANMAYDEMVRLMLAADELHPNDLDRLRATGFLARNWALFGRDLWMEETVEHVSKGFLGLTMNCAKCHEHKYDPIAQVDYYHMRACFEPYHVRLDMVPGEPDLARDGIPRAFDGRLDIPTYRYERGQESHPDKSVVIVPAVPKFLANDEFSVRPVSLPKEAWQPERRPWVRDSYKSKAQQQVAAAEASVAAVGAKLQVAEKRSQEIQNGTTDSERRAAEAALADARAELHIALLAEDAARAELVSFEKRSAAMEAEWVKDDGIAETAKPAEDVKVLSLAAVRSERQAAVAKARHAAAEFEFKLRQAPADGKQPLQAELNKARAALAKAEQSVAAIRPSDQYTRLIGAKWTATRALNSVQDDPEVHFPSQSTGRRSALAAWITSRRNPLAARVAVNHIWTRHMGAPLVATVFDFGRKGSPPTHPELLDWLAAEFVDSGWDMKHLHHLIVTSTAYRMSSSAAGRNADLAADPDNVFLWRRTPIRMESEPVRDAILALAGSLDLTRGGPPVLPAAQDESLRRSLYFLHSNNERNLFLRTFDEATVKECYRRDQSVVPQQALALCNSRLVHDAAEKIARRLSDRNLDDEQFVRVAFHEVLNIRASDEEVRLSIAALGEWRKLPGTEAEQASARARRNLVWALFNHNDFVTIR